MAKTQSGLSDVLNAIGRGPGRSTLFYYLVEHHDQLTREWAGSSIRWASLVARFKALGLTDRDGKTPTEQGARQTWRRARKAVQRSRLYQMTGVLKPSNRSGAAAPTRSNATAPAVAFPASQAGQRAIPPPTTDSSLGIPPRDGGPVSREAAQAKIAAFRKTLDERSGR